MTLVFADSGFRAWGLTIEGSTSAIHPKSWNFLDLKAFDPSGTVALGNSLLLPLHALSGCCVQFSRASSSTDAISIPAHIACCAACTSDEHALHP